MGGHLKLQVLRLGKLKVLFRGRLVKVSIGCVEPAIGIVNITFIHGEK